MNKLLCLLLLVCGYSLHAQTGEKIAYYYHGQKQFFSVNNARIVVQLSAGENIDGRRSQMATALHLQDTSIKLMGNQKRLSATFPAGINSVKIKERVASLIKQGYVDYVHSSFTSAYGKDMGYGDELVVKLKTSTSVTAFDNFLRRSLCSIVKKYPFANDTYIISAGAANGFDAMAVANQFYETGLFIYAEPDLTLFDGLFTNPNDPLFDYQWSHTNTGSAIQYNGVAGTDMKIQQAWNISTGAGITVAVIDEGVDTGHADLKANLLQGYNCLTGTANPGDGRPLGPARAHGTNCTGIIAAIANNNIGIAGVAPDSKIIPITLAAANGAFTSYANIAAGFDYAWQHGADVISNSWGGGSPSSIIEDAINRCVTLGRGGKGSVVLFASGNNNAALSYPAVLENVISVGGVNMCGQRKSPASSACDGEGWGASYGTGLDVSAPCVKIASTDLSGSDGYNTSAGAAGDYFLRFNGTSSATPATAGVTALILAANNSLTVSQLRNVLEGTCDKLPLYSYSMVSGQPNGTWNNETGYGLINAFHAVQVAQSGVFCNVQIQANGATRFCPGGSVNLAVTNPVAGTSYQWRKDGTNFNTGTGITATMDGSYDVVATATNSCVATSPPIIVSVLTNTPSLIANAGVDTFICAGQPVKLGGNPVAANGAPWLSDKRGFGMDWQSNSFVKFSLTNPLLLDTIAKNMVSDPDFNAGNFFTGGDFTPYGYYAITQVTNKLIKIDTATGAQQLIGIANAPAGYDWSGMSWDASTKNLYGIASASSGSALCIIDPFTASVTLVAAVPVGLTEWVAVSNNGNMYVMSDNNYVYSVNKTTGAATASSNPVGADVIYQQDADFDPLSDKLYLTTIILYQNYVGDLRTVDTNTGISSVIGALGGLSEIDATGIAGPGYQYNWSPAATLNRSDVSVPVATPLTTTTYTLNVTDMCGNTTSSQVTVHINPAPPITAPTDSICVGETVRLSAIKDNAYTYQWYRNGIAIAGAADSFYVASTGGIYTVTTQPRGCDLSLPFKVKTCEIRMNSNTAAAVCNSYFYDSGGPDSAYSNNESFTRTITASIPGNLLRLTLNSFASENGNDILTVYDGASVASPVLATLSASPSMPLVLSSSSGALTFNFTSNASTTGLGWSGILNCFHSNVYRSKNSGNADDVNTWEVKSGGIFINATDIPTLDDDSIIIRSGHTVTINNAANLDQIWVQNGAVLNVAAPLTLNNGNGSDLLTEGSLIVGAAGRIDGNGIIILTGTLDNSASAGSNVLVRTEVSGSTSQNILAGGSFTTLYISNPFVSFNMANSLTIDSLIIDNGSTGITTITATNPVSLLSVNSSLTLNNGRLIMVQNAILNVLYDNILTGGNSNSFVEGEMQITSTNTTPSLFFPVGKNVYRPVTVYVMRVASSFSTFQVHVLGTAPASRTKPASISSVSGLRYYRILDVNPAEGTMYAKVTLSYGSDDGVTDPASLRIAHEDGGTNWIDIGGSGTGAGTGTITSTVDFGLFYPDFVLANALNGTNTLPVTWVNVNAKLSGKQVDVSWKTANEINVAGYTVERSADGISFNTIASLNADTSNTVEKQYLVKDPAPLKGNNYYRIRQTDKDGKFSYSKTVVINFGTSLLSVWPNPATESVTIQGNETLQRVQVYNAHGQLIYDRKPSANQLTIPVKRWSTGIYSLKITTGSVTQKRFVKQ